MRYFAVSIYDQDGGSGEMKVACENKTEARQHGRLYIRQWNLRGGKIEYIREMSKAEFWTGRKYEDAPGRSYILDGVDEGPYNNLFRLRPLDGGDDILVSSYELEHYYRRKIA